MFVIGGLLREVGAAGRFVYTPLCGACWTCALLLFRGSFVSFLVFQDCLVSVVPMQACIVIFSPELCPIPRHDDHEGNVTLRHVSYCLLCF